MAGGRHTEFAAGVRRLDSLHQDQEKYFPASRRLNVAEDDGF